MSSRAIALRGVQVHNLKKVDVDIAHQKLMVVCGVSGSGKTSLALDTLYAEGQRRYIESFSAYTRQFLERLDKPDADRIDGIPPAIAVTHDARSSSRSGRSTVGTATEIIDYLGLLFAKIGRVTCHGCGCAVVCQTPQSAADSLAELPSGTRIVIAFHRARDQGQNHVSVLAELQEDGFVRVVMDGRIVDLASVTADTMTCDEDRGVDVVVDRLVVGRTPPERLLDSLETAMDQGDGECLVYADLVVEDGSRVINHTNTRVQIDGRPWLLRSFCSALRCGDCGIEYPESEPRLYSFISPLGACPECEGFGSVIDIDMDLVVPDPGKSLREGAVAPWNTPAYAHELEELLAIAPDYDIAVDIPYRNLASQQLALIREGIPERDFGGLNGFFAWLERRTYKIHIRAFLGRWRSYRTCGACQGNRLRPESLATRVGDQSIAEISRTEISKALVWLDTLEFDSWERSVAQGILDQVTGRMRFLVDVGLGYLSLDRTLRTLSGGEAQRVALTSAMGSNLVNMLYVLDEPSVGLHAHDIDHLLDAIRRLRDRGNTVVVVEHEEVLIKAADELLEIGPGAGDAGGRIVYQGVPENIVAAPNSLTGDYLAGRRGVSVPQRRPSNQGKIRLIGARGNNLKNLTVDFPLGLLCVVAGVSGAGKSTLVQETLYPALCRRLHKEVPAKPYENDDIVGDGQIEDVILVDQSPIVRSARSNPVTYVKAFDEIRAVFADTLEARTHNYTASQFSFNVDGGRCSGCKGEGYLQIDMQFMPDVVMKCDQCGGRRYQKHILEVTYRGRNIAEVLDMTIREAFSFFRGQSKVQTRFKPLIDVGLDYLRLGQSVKTLSAGEAQRLKLASYVTSVRRGRTLFVLEEPTTGLHFADVVKLLDCFDALLAVGHSLVVVEHNLQLMKSADYIIDLGPGAADDGGSLVAMGTPEEVAANPRSVTGRHLARSLARIQEQSA